MVNKAGTKDLTDENITLFASKLPHLRVLSLLTYRTVLTEEAVLALGKHCPLLERCRLSAHVSWENFAVKATLGLFRQLEELKIGENRRRSGDDEEVLSEDELLERLVALAPNVVELVLHSWDTKFAKRWRMLLEQRRAKARLKRPRQRAHRAKHEDYFETLQRFRYA